MKRTRIRWPKPIKWDHPSDNEWFGNEPHTRIKRSTNRWLELDYDDYYVYRHGLYLGTRRSLKAAKALAERNPRGNDNGAEGT